LLGYCYPEIDKAIIQQLYKGTLFTLPSILETKLAERLNKLIPCAEQMRFLKTGSEATSAAVKIARAYTGREKIIVCGYHGWHDWYTVSTPKNKGIPVRYKDLVVKAEYNNLESFEIHLKKEDVACVILEPYIYDAPKDLFLNKLINMAHKYGTLVIFDEVVTGFRTLEYSAQKFFKATPDLACFGKAMANGLPISVVCGKKEFMKELEGDCFVSSTFGGELLSIAASLAVLDVLDKYGVVGHIYQMGSQLKDTYNLYARELDIDTKCIGYPNRTMFMFPTGDHKGLFWQECIKEGVLFGYAQFINYSHAKVHIDDTLDTVRQALKTVKKNWKNPRKAINGKPPQEVFRLVATRS